jgi:hypothetical protein
MLLVQRLLFMQFSLVLCSLHSRLLSVRSQLCVDQVRTVRKYYSPGPAVPPCSRKQESGKASKYLMADKTKTAMFICSSPDQGTVLVGTVYFPVRTVLSVRVTHFFVQRETPHPTPPTYIQYVLYTPNRFNQLFNHGITRLGDRKETRLLCFSPHSSTWRWPLSY